MSTEPDHLTPYPDVNDILRLLLNSIQNILGDHLIGFYLDGSLTTGTFDQDSDIDFVAVTDEDISHEQFLALHAMHDRIAASDSPWAINLEGTYLSAQAIRRFDLAHTQFPNLQRGGGGHLKMADHGEEWNIHRYLVRERGITLFGPPPHTLIDPVSPDDLRRAAIRYGDWLAHILEHPALIQGHGYQSYIVLSTCRVLYTIECGDVASKPAAAQWAKETLGTSWTDLIDRAWEGRHQPDQPAPPNDVQRTLDLIRLALARIQKFQLLDL